MEKEIKKAMKIITNIAHAGDFENMKKVYMIYGIETVEKAIKVCNLLKDFTVPQIVMDVRGSVIPEFYSKIINDIKNASSFESQVAIARAYGLQSCVKATSQYKQKYNTLPDFLVDVLGELTFEEKNENCDNILN